MPRKIKNANQLIKIELIIYQNRRVKSTNLLILFTLKRAIRLNCQQV